MSGNICTAFVLRPCCRAHLTCTMLLHNRKPIYGVISSFYHTISELLFPALTARHQHCFSPEGLVPQEREVKAREITGASVRDEEADRPLATGPRRDENSIGGASEETLQFATVCGEGNSEPTLCSSLSACLSEWVLLQ